MLMCLNIFNENFEINLLLLAGSVSVSTKCYFMCSVFVYNHLLNVCAGLDFS